MKIYRIVSEHSAKCYVGKTTKTLSKRFGGHKSGFQHWLDGRGKWCSSYGLLWLGDCTIELLQETDDKDAERNWIARLDCVNTRRMEYGLGDQYDGSAYDKAYRKAKPQHKRVYRKDYYERRKADLNAKSLAYHRAHAAEIKVRNAERVACDRCGTETRRGGMRQHQKTKKCKEFAAGKVHKRERVICDRCGSESNRGDLPRHQKTKKCQTKHAASCEK